MKPLAIGTRVRIIEAPRLDGDRDPEQDEALYASTLSEPTTIVAIQWITPEGEIVDEEQDEFQYLLDAEEPHPDIAVRPEYVEEA